MDFEQVLAQHSPRHAQLPEEPPAPPPLDVMNSDAFETLLEKAIENGIEKGIEKGNTTVCKKDLAANSEVPKFLWQDARWGKAQYGRLMPLLVRRIMDLAKISSADRVVDLGSGIGSVVIQLALTLGCEAWGIELMGERYKKSIELLEYFKKMKAANTEKATFTGSDFLDFWGFMSSYNIWILNNANDIFGSRANKDGAVTLDYRTTLMACDKLPLGGKLICFTELFELENSLTSTCFVKETTFSGPGETTWTLTSNKQTPFYIYTRVKEGWDCTNCNRKNIPLVTEDLDGFNTTCVNCLCTVNTESVKRKRMATDFYHANKRYREEKCRRNN